MTTIRDLRVRRVQQPPAAVPNEYLQYFRDVADALNYLPPFSLFSLTNPNSQVTAIPGTLGFNLNSANTAKLWIKEIGSGNTGWASLTTATTSNTTLASGLYLPTLTNDANLSASSAYYSQWLRVGNTVTVSGRADIDPTLAATTTTLGISLPVASNFTLVENCSGSAAATGIAGQSAGITADTSNDRASMTWVSGDITNQPMCYAFTYVIA